MPDRINPRPLFRRAIEMLAMSECPHCHRALGTRSLIINKPDYHCAWCAAREQLVDEFKEWKRQDAAAAREKKKAPQRGASG